MRTLATRHTDRALKALKVGAHPSLRENLLHLGTGHHDRLDVPIRGSRSTRSLVSESNRFGAAADAYWESAPQRAIEAIREVLLQAQRRGEIDIDDASIVARQFVAMLRGGYSSGGSVWLRRCPDATDIQGASRVRG